MPEPDLPLAGRIQQALAKQERQEPLAPDDFLLLFARQVIISYSHQERGYGQDISHPPQ